MSGGTEAEPGVEKPGGTKAGRSMALKGMLTVVESKEVAVVRPKEWIEAVYYSFNAMKITTLKSAAEGPQVSAAAQILYMNEGSASSGLIDLDELDEVVNIVNQINKINETAVADDYIHVFYVTKDGVEFGFTKFVGSDFGNSYVRLPAKPKVDLTRANLAAIGEALKSCKRHFMERKAKPSPPDAGLSGLPSRGSDEL